MGSQAVDIATLTLFIAVMRQGSFAAVARDRNIDPSSVSRAIAALETELGTRLFQRTTRRLSPTEAGSKYFERIEPLLEEIQQANNLATETSEHLGGTLRITASVAFGLKCIVPILPRLEAKYPDLTVDLLLTDAVVDLLAERIDVAVRLGRLADSTLIAQRLMKTHYRVCASPSYLVQAGIPHQPEAITEHNCLLFPLPGFRSRWLFKHRDKSKSQTAREVAVSGRTMISNAIALQRCALSGMGIALLPHWLVDDDIQSGSLVDLFPTCEVTATDFNTAAWLVYPSRIYVPQKARVFIDFLKSTYSATSTAPLTSTAPPLDR